MHRSVDAVEDRGHDLTVAGRPPGTFGVGLVAGDEPAQKQRLGHRMLVGGNGWTEGEVSEGLQGIVEFIEPIVARYRVRKSVSAPVVSPHDGKMTGTPPPSVIMSIWRP